MKSYVITIPNHHVSQNAANICITSSIKVENDFTVKKFNAVTPQQVKKVMKDFRVQWNYPWEGEIFDFKTGLKKKSYPTVNKEARIACALSHYTLWKESADNNETLLVMEHDAKFVKKLDVDEIEQSKYNIIGINNPLFATRKAQLFKQLVEGSSKSILPVPSIDSFDVPQGLAGNSAYVIKPRGAKDMIKLVEDHGLWPNDALMCKQLVKSLAVTKTFYTEVQGTPSTTTR